MGAGASIYKRAVTRPEDLERAEILFVHNATDVEWFQRFGACGGCGNNAQDCCGGCSTAICLDCEVRIGTGEAADYRRWLARRP